MNQLHMTDIGINQLGFPILSLMMLFPLLGAFWCFLAPGTPEWRAQNARVTALAVTLIDLGFGVLLWTQFDLHADTSWQFIEHKDLFGRFSWSLGVDGIAMLLIVMTVFLTPMCVLASWRSITDRVPEFMGMFMIVELMLLGVFMAQDLFLFYIMFEGSLVPMFMLIGIWGGRRRFYASYKFFLYTLLGSLLMMIAMLYMANKAGTTYIPTLMQHDFSRTEQTWLFFAFFASFAVKTPMWPVHTWLPDAHVQAPTAASVDLAAVMLKLGGYGFLRFSLPMFPDASADYMWLIFALSLIAVVYTSLVALVQQDMKKLIAYSSVAHMAIVTMALFTFNEEGIEGALMIMFAHGLVSGALFLCVGVIYDRLHTREIDRFGGLARNMPVFATFLLFFSMASIGLPGLSSFPGELLSMIGLYHRSSWAAVIATTSIITSAAYMLYLCRRVIFGPLKHPDAAAMFDLRPREWAMFAPIAAVVLWMGVYPESFLRVIRPDVGRLISRIDHYAPPSDSALKANNVPAATAAAGEH
ncbi:NADH-quinone oxidoreductase subunit M [Sphingomonas abietis]|uniref:NADH-quinone oxidoreductase subunit M n=1 Tax=Sphingomonas abietis TaxID=3012344 RepID=A0ABY7NQ42_9SPHN|nr:NADH-quinone oxidoreductase subunit M [Sphingomonas abietis]WBO23652.1 NADH-quinone oxidoreductase subunit M [Sphingomonas abietis]